jgi:hypothetical protein
MTSSGFTEDTSTVLVLTRKTLGSQDLWRLVRQAYRQLKACE